MIDQFNLSVDELDVDVRVNQFEGDDEAFGQAERVQRLVYNIENVALVVEDVDPAPDVEVGEKQEADEKEHVGEAVEAFAGAQHVDTLSYNKYSNLRC